MLHTKFCGNQPTGSGEEDFRMVFTIYGCGSHLGHPRLIICKNYDGLESPMLHTKFCGNRPTGSGEEDFRMVFTIYGCGSHLGHVTKIW